ncbi:MULTISPECIES: helix-turn-helix domain-containing protein [Pseudonocardia]|uniref:helix-turn-helix domain-containing protein n=1 Tax=Pseudonocardia TaxID=1847 RepID=UPI0035A25133
MQTWGPLRPLEDRQLRRLRQAVPMTMSELAERAGCSFKQVHRIETTMARPSGELATRIAHVLTEALGRPVSRYEFFTPRPPRPRRTRPTTET